MLFFLKFFVLNCLLLIGLGCTEAIGVDSGAKEVVYKLFSEHQPWKGKNLNWESREVTSRFFDSNLVSLFQSEYECKVKERDVCSLESDPVYFSQDFPDGEAELVLIPVKNDSPKGMSYKVNVKFSKWTIVLVVRVKETSAGWRISDIQNESLSLKLNMQSTLQSLGYFNLLK